MVIDLEGTILFINPAAAQMLGRTETELVGEQFGYPLTPGENTEIELLSGSGYPDEFNFISSRNKKAGIQSAIRLTNINLEAPGAKAPEEKK